LKLLLLKGADVSREIYTDSDRDGSGVEYIVETAFAVIFHEEVLELLILARDQQNIQYPEGRHVIGWQTENIQRFERSITAAMLCVSLLAGTGDVTIKT
jgi:hypothetical protein